MLFNSLEFLLFFPLVLVFYYLLDHRFRWILLLAASCFFYMYFKPEYILILVVITVIDYFAARAIQNSTDKKKRKRLLILSITSNLLILCIFKYFNFFNENFTGLCYYFGTENPIPALNIILPVGLSFHTFQAMSYTIDVYRGELKAEKHFGIYALYEMFFPQLVAGPIERASHIIPQFYEKHKPDELLWRSGLRLILWGFFKKVVIADNLSPIVDRIYASPDIYSSATLLIATFFFTVQIYCDFSGYSDIAVGLARLLGFRLMRNFYIPYFANSIGNFWKRWHISLSTWFRDYLYIPLGGNRVSKLLLLFNILLVFTLSGFWHGANWTFIIWGALHGIYLIIGKLSGKSFTELFPNVVKQFVVFLLVMLAWIFFRANNVEQAFYVVKSIFMVDNSYSLQFISELNLGNIKIVILILAGLFLFMWSEKYFLHSAGKEFLLKHNWLRTSAYFILFISILLFGNTDEVQFIYFQF